MGLRARRRVLGVGVGEVADRAFWTDRNRVSRAWRRAFWLYHVHQQSAPADTPLAGSDDVHPPLIAARAEMSRAMVGGAPQQRRRVHQEPPGVHNIGVAMPIINRGASREPGVGSSRSASTTSTTPPSHFHTA